MFKNKQISVVVSVLLAILIWGYVVSTVNPSKTQVYRDIPINILNASSLADRGLAVASNTSFTGDIVLEAKRNDFINLNRSGISLSADLSTCTIGENSVPVTVRIPSSFSVYELRTEYIDITIDELVSEEREIRLVYTGTAPFGKEPSSASLSPSRVEVSGAKAIVDRVNYIQAAISYDSIPDGGGAVSVDLSPMGSQGSMAFTPASAEKSELALSPLILSRSMASAYVELLDVKQVELEAEVIGQPAAGYAVESVDIPSKISIKGKTEALADITAVTAAPIDVSGMSESTDVALRFDALPDGISLADASKDLTVAVRIEEAESKVFTIEGEDISLEIRNGSEELGYEYELASIEVRIYAESAILARIEEGDIRLYIDAAGLEEGTHTLPIGTELKLDEFGEEGTPPEGEPEELAAAEEEAGDEDAASDGVTIENTPKNEDKETIELPPESRAAIITTPAEIELTIVRL